MTKQYTVKVGNIINNQVEIIKDAILINKNNNNNSVDVHTQSGIKFEFNNDKIKVSLI